MKVTARQGPTPLPPPPAPTARDANPWQFSDTARAAPPPPARQGYERLIEEIQQARIEREGGAAEEPPEAEVDAGQAPPSSSFNRVIPIVIFLVMFGSVARDLIESGGADPALVVAGFVFLAILAGLLLSFARRRSRRRQGR